MPVVVRIVVVLEILLGAVSAWCQYSPSSGTYRVLTVDRIVLHDATRNKTIPLKIYYPDAPGPFPVIIFSHGALASKDYYSGLGQYWASFGYISIHPSHADSMADSGFRGTVQDAISDPRAWQNRPRDISFVIDSLPEIEQLAPQLRGKLDRKHIGVGGHSFGAYTAELVGGLTITVPGKGPQNFADKRVSAILLLSPEGEGRMGLTAQSWDHLHLPMLLMFGSRDFGPWGEPPIWRSEAYRMAPSGDKFQVELEDGTHMGFSGPLPGADSRTTILTKQFQCARVETLAFWDTYLKHSRKAQDYLRSDGLRKSDCETASFASK